MLAVGGSQEDRVAFLLYPEQEETFFMPFISVRLQAPPNWARVEHYLLILLIFNVLHCQVCLLKDAEDRAGFLAKLLTRINTSRLCGHIYLAWLIELVKGSTPSGWPGEPRQQVRRDSQEPPS